MGTQERMERLAGEAMATARASQRKANALRRDGYDDAGMRDAAAAARREAKHWAAMAAECES